MQRSASLAIAVGLLLAGCAGSPGQYRALVDSQQTQPRASEITQAPFFPQEAYQCGPAALATLMVHIGEDTSPEELSPRVYLPERRGSLQAELLGASRRQGLVAYVHEPYLADLLEEVGAGNPVLVLQNLGLNRIPVWHYAVLIGYDLDAGEIILRSGTERREVMSLRHFERTWRLAEHWALTVHHPGDLPATARPQRFLEAVAALERLPDHGAAGAGYSAALKRWPEAVAAWIGLGNVRYAEGRYAAAEEAYRGAVNADPGHPAAHHNLAWALIRQDRPEEAFAAAERAARLAAPEQEHYFTALEALRQTEQER